MNVSADFWRPFLAKFVAPLVGLLFTIINKKYGIEFSQTETDLLVASLVDMVVFAISTGVTAVGINKFVNPGNAASSHLASAEKVESQLIKARTDQYEAMKDAQKGP
jgi:hypothetical protein